MTVGHWRRRDRTSTSTPLLGAFLLAFVLSAACDGEVLGPGSGGPPEDLGDPVLTARGEVLWRSKLAWAGNDEIIYIGANTKDLKGVRVSDGAIRLLNTSPGRIDDFFPSPDEQWIYRVRSGPGPPYVLDRVPQAGGAAEVIANDIWMWPSSALPPLSKGSDLLAYAARGEKQPPGTNYVGSTQDTLYLLDLQTGALTNLGFGLPLTFSPDASELLYDEKPCIETGLYRNPCDTYTLNLTTLARTHVPWAKGDLTKTAWWDASGIHGLVRCRDVVPGPATSWCVRNLSTGSVEILYSHIVGEEVVAFDIGLAVSADRRKVAGWSHHRKHGFVALHVIDRMTGAQSLPVVVRTAAAYRIAFSPDGTRVAYQLVTWDGTGPTVQIFVHEL